MIVVIWFVFVVIIFILRFMFRNDDGLLLSFLFKLIVNS